MLIGTYTSGFRATKRTGAHQAVQDINNFYVEIFNTNNNHKKYIRNVGCQGTEGLGDVYLVVWRELHGCNRVDVFLHFIEEIVPTSN